MGPLLQGTKASQALLTSVSQCIMYLVPLDLGTPLRTCELLCACNLGNCWLHIAGIADRRAGNGSEDMCTCLSVAATRYPAGCFHWLLLFLALLMGSTDSGRAYPRWLNAMKSGLNTSMSTPLHNHMRAQDRADASH